MLRNWKYLTHSHYEWDVSLPSAGTLFKLAITKDFDTIKVLLD